MLVLSLKPRRPRFNLRSGHVRFVVENAPLGHFLLQVFRVSAVNIMTPMLHYNLHLLVALPRKTNGQAWEPSLNQCSFGNREKLDRTTLSFFFCLSDPVKCGSWISNLLIFLPRVIYSFRHVCKSFQELCSNKLYNGFSM